LKSHSGWFLETGSDLAERGVKAYVFDRRGSGLSDGARGHAEAYRDWLEDIRAVVQLAREEHPGKPVHLLGHCFGAKLALGFALRFPKLAETLSLIAPPQFSLKADISLPEKAKVAWGALWGRRLRLRVPIRDDMFTRDPERCQFIREDELKLESVTAQFYMQVFWMDRWLHRALPSLAVPTLVMVGREDVVVDPFKVQSRLFPRLGCRRKAMEVFDCWHDLLFEPLRMQVLERVVSWLRGDGDLRSSPNRVPKPLQVAGEAR
jgi:alpha-beta hydrolase superfamily lysophospholipase